MNLIQYIHSGFVYLASNLYISLGIYLLLFIALYFTGKRQKTNYKTYFFEFILCLYIVTVLKITGIINVEFNLGNIHNGFTEMNLTPFVGASFKMLLLNFLLFTPYGILVSIVFNKRNWNYKSIILLSIISSFTIETLQILTGRFVELDDILMNSSGTLAGYLAFISLKNCLAKNSLKKGLLQLFLIISTCFICFYGISLACTLDDIYKPDGLKAIDNSNIKEINLHKNGNIAIIDDPEYLYSNVSNTLSNCGGHIFNINDIRKTKTQIMDNSHVYIQILFNEPETINFVNSSDLVLNETSHILYDVNDYMLYWGTHDNLLHSVSYMELGSDLQEHKDNVKEQLDSIIPNN